MNLISRLFIGLALSAVALTGTVGGAFAQSYPSKPVSIYTSSTAGSPSDILARILGQKFTESFGQPVVVQNRGGGNTTIGTEVAAKTAPDGYNLFLGQSVNLAVVPALYKHGSSTKLSYDTARDFVPVAYVGSVPLILGVYHALPVKSLKELIALAKSKPGKLNYGTSGHGGTPHLAMEMLKTMAGIDMVHVPYTGGGPQTIAIMGGQVDVGFISILSALPPMKTGKIRALAVSGAKRSPAVPDLPTVAEAGLPDFQVDPWFGLVAPKGTPREIVTKLNLEFNKYFKDPKVKEQLATLGIEAEGMTPEQFGQYIRAEISRWDKVVKESGVKLN